MRSSETSQIQEASSVLRNGLQGWVSPVGPYLAEDHEFYALLVYAAAPESDTDVRAGGTEATAFAPRKGPS